jgi:flagellar biosynthesis protein FlhG
MTAERTTAAISTPTARPPQGPSAPASGPAGVARPAGTNLVTIASGKGGVGKTWLSTTTAHALARSGQKVLLFDGDFGLANVDIQLGLAPVRDIASVIAQGAPIRRAITHFASGGFDIVAGKSGSGMLAALGRPQVAALRNHLLDLSSDYDRILIDIGAGVDAAQTTFTTHGGITLVVTNDEPTALTDAYAFIKIAAMRHNNPRLAVVINMASSKAEGMRTYETLARACETFLKLKPPLAAIVRRDPKVRDSIRHQQPILLRHPTTGAARDAEGLAKFLLSVTARPGG